MEATIFLASLAGYGRLRGAGVTPGMLVGHGFGEIAALVAAGAFSTADGLAIVAGRARALARGCRERFGMASVEGPREHVLTLLDLLRADGVSLAAENSPTHSVVVGPPAAIAAATAVAEAMNLAFVTMQAKHGPHRSSMAGVRDGFAAALRHLRRRPFQTPVFSPLLARAYRNSDDLIDCLAEQMVQPIRFADAVAQLKLEGISLIVECGPLHGLARSLDCKSLTDAEYYRLMSLTATSLDSLRRASGF
jgi:acyl transferase domain-containing protein